MQFEGIRTVLHHGGHDVLKSSKGIKEPLMLRSGWCSCIRRDSSRWIFFDRRCFPTFPVAWS